MFPTGVTTEFRFGAIELLQGGKAMRFKVKHLMILVLAIAALAVFIGIGSAADGPAVYVRYYPNGGNVVAHVYWDDSTGGPYTFRWANDAAISGNDLAWQSSGLTRTNVGLSTQKTVLTLTPNKNYFFKIYNGSNITIVRAFPASNVSSSGPRYQNDYAHGNFTPDTAMCAACHSTHTALKAQLLRQATYYELCMLCHSSSNSQSKYDVETGHVYTGAGWAPSLAGPIKMGAGLATSRHDVDDTVYSTTEVPGSDPTKVLTFTCVSCHNGHATRNDNYRLLKKTIYPADNQWNPQTVNFVAYAITRSTTVGEEVYLVSGNAEFCSACHLDYDEGNAMVAGGVYNTVYRHPVTVGSSVYSVEPRGLWPTTGDILPLQYYGGASATDKRTAVVCETCHFAHGTTKSFNVYIPQAAPAVPQAVSNKKMLRLDNYGVCESCHKK